MIPIEKVNSLRFESVAPKDGHVCIFLCYYEKSNLLCNYPSFSLTKIFADLGVWRLKELRETKNN